MALPSVLDHLNVYAITKVSPSRGNPAPVVSGDLPNEKRSTTGSCAFCGKGA